MVLEMHSTTWRFVRGGAGVGVRRKSPLRAAVPIHTDVHEYRGAHLRKGERVRARVNSAGSELLVHICAQ